MTNASHHPTPAASIRPIGTPLVTSFRSDCWGEWAGSVWWVAMQSRSQAAAIRSIETCSRCDDPLSTTQNTRSALAYGSVVMTWATSRANGSIPVVGSSRPITRACCTL